LLILFDYEWNCARLCKKSVAMAFSLVRLSCAEDYLGRQLAVSSVYLLALLLRGWRWLGGGGGGGKKEGEVLWKDPVLHGYRI